MINGLSNRSIYGDIIEPFCKPNLMTKTPAHVPLAGVALDRRDSLPLCSQIYEALRQRILDGKLRPGGRLPSTRLMATQFGVSRNTVMSAFAQLSAEGYTEARVGSGTRVARSLPQSVLSVRARPTRAPPPGRREGGVSQRGELLSSRPVRVLSPRGAPRPFASGLPDCRAFPFRTWARLMARRWRHPHHQLLGYGDPAGYQPLREAIAAHLRAARAVRCEANQVLILSGSQQALDLAARLLIDPGDKALIEDPGYPGARVALTAAGAKLIPLPVGFDGADISSPGKAHPTARVVFVTPSHQFPLGVTMSLPRRLALLEWAHGSGAWILEDDYDSEYRYRGKPLPSLQGLDISGRVIYVGTFSKTLFPSLRLGFMVLPPELVESFRRARSVVDGHSPLTEQVVLADFIAEGHFARHVRRMRALYQERQSMLVDAAGKELAGLVDIAPSDGGMHLVARLPKRIPDVVAAERALAHGVYVNPLSRCAIGEPSQGGLLLGYAALSRKQIVEGVQRLGNALRTLST